MKLLFREHNPQLYGPGPLLFEWRPGGNNIAVAGTSGVVRVFNRYNEVTEEFNINEEVIALSWDPQGDLLAIANGRTATLVLYECSTGQIHTVDASTGAKAALPTLLSWNPKRALLLVGDNRGNFVLFDYRLSRKVPVMGKHQRAIRTGAWSRDGAIFALGSEDTQITVNNADGETLNTFSCNGDIVELKFATFRSMAADREEDYISAIVAHKNFMIVRLSEPEQPANLQFQERYGNLVRTVWFGNGNVLVAFDLGFIVCLSAERSGDSISQELFSIQEYKTSLASIAVSEPMRRLYSIGDNLLKGRDLSDLSEVSDLVDVDSDDSGLVQLACSEDGSLAAVSARSGALCVYLTRLPMLASASPSQIAVLASLTEISIYQDGNIQPSQSLNIKVEPSLIAAGDKHIAIVLNNKAWFYEIKRNTSVFLYEHDYMTTILKMKLSRDFVMARLDQRVHLHKILRSDAVDANAPSAMPPSASTSSGAAPSDGAGGGDVLFPDCNESAPKERVLDADLADKFFLYSTAGRQLHYYSLAHHRFVSDFRHSAEICAIYAEPDGIRCLFLDGLHDVYVYSSADGRLCKIRRQGPFQSSHHYLGCLWETFTVDKDTFAVHDQHTLFVFMLARADGRQQEEEGTAANFISQVQVPHGNVPLLLSKGIVYCHTQNGRLNTVLLKSHKTETQLAGKSPNELKGMLQQSLLLRRWRNAWKICEELKEQASWRQFAHSVMLECNIELAVRIFRHLGDVAMVWALEQLRHIEDQQVLSGHVATLLGNFDHADQLFSASSEPKNALEMRRDVQHWERALELARQIAPHELPHIAKEYAIQLEFMGQHEQALRFYEEALIGSGGGDGAGGETEEQEEEHILVCKSGLARMALHMGDLKRGVEIALKLPSRLAKRDCGIVLEQLRQFDEAGAVYEAGQFYDRAAAAYLKSRNLLKVHKLMEQVRSPKLLCQYGKMLEKEKNFERAYKAYERAHDAENQIRLLLRNLAKPSEAVKLAQESRSVEGSKMVANYFSDLGQFDAAIKFLVISHCYQEAFDLAKSSGQVLVYARALDASIGQQGSVGQGQQDAAIGHFSQLAEHFRTDGDALNAGKFAGMAKQFQTALSLLTSEQADAANEEEALQYAIEFAAESGDTALVNTLIGHLMGENKGEGGAGGGVPKDPKFLFQLYVKMKMYKEGAKTALIIAQEQQAKGFYKGAHDLLFGTYQTLRKEAIRIPSEMGSALMLLHSYNIAKAVMKKGDNLVAANLLCRVAANIGQFPTHAAQLLTSCVIMCTKAGMKDSAFKFASQLMQPMYRQKIDEKYKKKIELIVRKFGQNATDPEEKSQPCPFCDSPVLEFTLSCYNCRSTIPYCILTGRHVIKEDFAQCPHCHFPGFFSEFNRLFGANCPMCYEQFNEPILPGNFDEFSANNPELTGAK